MTSVGIRIRLQEAREFDEWGRGRISEPETGEVPILFSVLSPGHKVHTDPVLVSSIRGRNGDGNTTNRSRFPVHFEFLHIQGIRYYLR